MRSLFVASFVPALALVACASSPSEPISTAPNVRARLAAPTRLVLSPTTSTGSITAKRAAHDGWQSGTLALAVADGDVTATAGAQLAVSELGVSLQPIAIPDSVFGKPARLEDVRLTLASAAAADIAWRDDDDASANASLQLDLSWTLVLDGNATPLGTQHLAAMPVAFTLSGDGPHVDATLSAHASGAVWSWAGLLELDDLELALSASTID